MEGGLYASAATTFAEDGVHVRSQTDPVEKARMIKLGKAPGAKTPTIEHVQEHLSSLPTQSRDTFVASLLTGKSMADSSALQMMMGE